MDVGNNVTSFDQAIRKALKSRNPGDKLEGAVARRNKMSEQALLYSSYPIRFEELSVAILSAGGKPVTLEEARTAILTAGGDLTGLEDSPYTLLGRVEDGEAHVLLWGSRHPKDDSTRFREENEPYIGEKLLADIQAKLGAEPVVSFSLEIGHASKSGLLAVELAYQCAIRWPCIVWVEVLEADEWIVKVSTKDDMARLRVERKTFIDYGDDDDQDEPAINTTHIQS